VTGKTERSTAYLAQALILRRQFQRFIDANADTSPDGLSQYFTLDGADFRKVTGGQRAILMELAPEDVRKLNE
jgi:hypothetical protein